MFKKDDANGTALAKVTNEGAHGGQGRRQPNDIYKKWFRRRRSQATRKPFHSPRAAVRFSPCRRPGAFRTTE